MGISRRRVLKSTPVLAIGIAGCSTGGNRSDNSDGGDVDENTERPDSDNDGIPDIRDDYPNDPDRSQRIRSVSDTRNLEEDQWRYYTINFSEPGILEYDFIVRDGPAIDVIMMDESEYQYFENEERWEYYTDLSALDTTGDEVRGRIGSGTYRLIFDNSNQGEAAPPSNFSNDVVSVEFTIEASQ
jgi:hypothetical protein